MKKTDPKRTAGGAKAKKTRDKLLLRAADLFARHGYDGVGMQQIAEVADVTKGSLYYHFEGKRHIYTESVALVISTAFEGEMPALKGTPDEQLDQYLTWILSVMKRHSLARRLLLHMMIDHDIALLEQLMKGVMGRSLDMFMTILGRMKLKKDKSVLAFFVYNIFTLNYEFASLTDSWLPNMETKLGGNKMAAYLKALIESW